jgi:type IV pilus assembly protein PilM
MISVSKTALGIDITQERISMALVKKQGDSLKLLKTAECPVPEGVIKKGNVEDPAALAKAIKYLKIKNRMYSNRIAMSLVANPVLAQILDLPKEVTGNVRQFITNEVKHYAVLPIKKTTLDFCKIKSSAGTENRRVLIVAADGQKISAAVQALYKQGISIDVIEPEWMAYARACFQKIISKNQNSNLLFAVINKDALTLSLFKDRKLDFVRTQPLESADIRSETFSNWLVEQINAVMKFYEYGVSKKINKWHVTILTPQAQENVTEQCKNIESMLAGKASLEIRNHETAYIDTPIAAEKIKNVPSAVAIGLAMKILTPTNDDLNINLVPSDSVQIKSREKKNLILANIAASIVVIMILSVLFFNTEIAKVQADTSRNISDSSSQDMKMMISENNRLEKEITELSGRLDNITGVIKTDSVLEWGPILKDIGSAIPKQTRLASIRSSESGILLSGQALSNEAVYLFVDSLKGSKSIKSASIIEAKKDSQSNMLVNYSIICVPAQ